MMIMHLHFYSPYQPLISFSKVILELLSCAAIIRQLPKAHPSPIEAVGSGRHQRWAVPLCSGTLSLDRTNELQRILSALDKDAGLYPAAGCW